MTPNLIKRLVSFATDEEKEVYYKVLNKSDAEVKAFFGFSKQIILTRFIAAWAERLLEEDKSNAK